MSTTVECPNCEHEMVLRRSRIAWVGDYEYENQHWECVNACMVEADVSFAQFIPVDVARMRE